MKKPLPRDTGGAQLLPGEERRRSQRVMVRVAVTLQVVVGGQKLTLAAVTVSVNDHGVMVLSPRTFAVDSKLEVKNDRTGQTMTCRVTRSAIESEQGYLIPLEFERPAPGFWQISFPPTDWQPLED